MVLMLLQGAILLLASLSCGAAGAATMTNSWAVQVTSGGQQAADALATKYRFINLGQIGNLDNVYHFQRPLSEQADAISDDRAADHITRQLLAEEQVVFAEQQVKRKRYKKEYTIPDDEFWHLQWSLDNRGQVQPEDVGHDIKAEQVWLQGVTGCGSVVAVVDDGVEYNNTDLSSNYVSAIQADFLEGDGDPFPEDYDGSREGHGTSCAGEITMQKGNGMCGVGVAYNAFLTGVRLISALEGNTDIEEAGALSWQGNSVDIYSCSWGPSDSGSVVEGPGAATRLTLKTAVEKGRGGKGSIYVFAAGNGGQNSDTCATDGYVSSMYTIGVGSVSTDGSQSFYDEECSGKLVVAFTDDPDVFPYKDVVVPNVYDSCSTDFIGTSASAPLVSGVIALALEANPDLTWRDVQYLIAYTANARVLVDGDWSVNGAGLLVSHKFGFGAIDAEAIVSRARHWINVPPQLSMNVDRPRTLTIKGDRAKNLNIRVPKAAEVEFLEYVEVIFSMRFPQQPGQRGQIEVTLTSPSGTASTLLRPRIFDTTSKRYNSWSLISVHFWGEDPVGAWTLNFRNHNPSQRIQVDAEMVLYGTSEVPESVSEIPLVCPTECDPSRGCAAYGSRFCDACRQLRIASSLECTAACPEGLSERNGYCYDAGAAEAACDVEPPTAIPI